MTRDCPPRPVVLCILDGWGHRADAPDNAITRACTPVWDRFMSGCPHALLDASSADVGLPDGQFGNSEVGHMSIGAGRVVMQDLPRIDRAVADGSLAANPVLDDFVARLGASGGICHLFGLMSPGGVHSHQSHMAALAGLIAGRGVPVAVHAFLDGRDTLPGNAARFIGDFTAATAGLGDIRLATLSGRYYAMDRDRRWDRVALAYETLVTGGGERAADVGAALRAAGARGESDEFVLPTALGDYGGMNDGDGLLIAHFRSDRVREIGAALLDPDFADFERPVRIDFAAACGLCSYSAALDARMTSLFAPFTLDGTLGKAVSAAGKRQLRAAETEKYAHVTFFLNGGEEAPLKGEERLLVPSPKVATYDLQPEMSAVELTDGLVAAIEGGRFDLIVVNYANGDMVGHTGNFDAAVRAVETIDACLGRLVDAIETAGGALLVTADHGNVETMRDHASQGRHTAHTENPVPVVLAVGSEAGCDLRDGRLADVAPTILDLLGLPLPAEMTGGSLLVPAVAGGRRASA